MNRQQLNKCFTYFKTPLPDDGMTFQYLSLIENEFAELISKKASIPSEIFAFACLYLNDHMVKKLLDYGVKNDNLALYCSIKHPKNLQLLLDHKANVNYEASEFYDTPLERALRRRWYDSATLLLLAGADLNKVRNVNVISPECIKFNDLLIIRKRNMRSATVAFFRVLQFKRVPKDLARHICLTLIKPTWNKSIWNDPPVPESKYMFLWKRKLVTFSTIFVILNLFFQWYDHGEMFIFNSIIVGFFVYAQLRLLFWMLGI